jgi:hypothetical protein
VRAQQAAENARDPEAPRLLKAAAQRWWQLAESAVQREKTGSSAENEVADGKEPGQRECNQ